MSGSRLIVSIPFLSFLGSDGSEGAGEEGDVLGSRADPLLLWIGLVGWVWCAMTVHDFYKNLNEFYSVVAEYDTPEACPTMSAGPGFVPSPLPSFISPTTSFPSPPYHFTIQSILSPSSLRRNKVERLMLFGDVCCAALPFRQTGHDLDRTRQEVHAPKCSELYRLRLYLDREHAE